jgi:hypothetical protein
MCRQRTVFTFVSHLIISSDVWIRTQRAVVTAGATNLATYHFSEKLIKRLLVILTTYLDLVDNV